MKKTVAVEIDISNTDPERCGQCEWREVVGGADEGNVMFCSLFYSPLFYGYGKMKLEGTWDQWAETEFCRCTVCLKNETYDYRCEECLKCEL